MPSATRRPGVPALAEGDLSRRTVAKGAAWSVPVIALGAPAAYAAASQLKSGACWLSTLAGTVNRLFGSQVGMTWSSPPPMRSMRSR